VNERGGSTESGAAPTTISNTRIKSARVHELERASGGKVGKDASWEKAKGDCECKQIHKMTKSRRKWEKGWEMRKAFCQRGMGEKTISTTKLSLFQDRGGGERITSAVEDTAENKCGFACIHLR